MLIHEFSQRSGVSTKTIRFYESLGLLPCPPRASNNYRQYSADALARLQFITGARALGFGLKDVAEFLLTRDDHQLPCQRVVDSLDTRIADLDHRIAELVALRANLVEIQAQAENLPSAENVKPVAPLAQCMCDLLTLDRTTGKISPLKESRTAEACPQMTGV